MSVIGLDMGKTKPTLSLVPDRQMAESAEGGESDLGRVG